ncbi:MAG: glycoside hydrolase family 3 N-terminal domain-containing protein [Bacteroidota bacterium]
MKRLLFVVSISLCALRCSTTNVAESLRQSSVPSSLLQEERAPAPSWVDSTLHAMTLEEKVGQLMIVWTTSHYLPSDSRRWQELVRYTTEKKVGGFYFSTGGVYEFPVQINKLQSLATTPLLITVDFEWGAGMRIGQATTFPRAMALGATRDTNLAYQMGVAIAREARALGVHQNYSPVVDVNNNPKNPVINTRSFGEDATLVAAMSRAVIRGQQDGKLMATVKHFPGHGDTDIDTHLDLPSLRFSRERMDSVELYPFRDAIKNGVLSVMTAHIHVTAFDSSDSLPATSSPNVITKLLKEELGFHGLVVTDALTMKGISKLFNAGEAAVRAVKAGADMLLMSPNTDEAIDSLIGAVQRKEISQQRLDESVRKILEMKQWVGLSSRRLVDVDSVNNVVGIKSHRDLAKEIARKSITVLGNESGIFPLKNINGTKVAFIVFSDTEDPTGNRELLSEFRQRASADAVIIDPRSNKMEFDDALAKAKKADLLICQFNYQMRSGAMSGFIPSKVVQLVNDLAALRKPMIGISTGNPYVVQELPTFAAFVQAYSSSTVSEEACIEVLFGEQPARGKLPITIPGKYKFGDGVTYDPIVISYGKPSDVGFDPVALHNVDTIITRAIADSAFPGAVLLVAKDGVVVHEKAYGRMTYHPTAVPMTTDAIFDLASVTKVIATTSAVMRLVDEGKISLNDPVVKYIPEFGQNGKDKITLYNLMVHNSGLQAWRKYYEICDSPKCVLDSIFAAPLVYATGDSTIYSDLGLITMGKVIERVTKTTLDKYVDSVFFKPLGMKNTMYNPSPSLWHRVVPTEIDSFWKKTYTAVKGRVHDENAATLGGVSGHAGLFSTAGDLVKILQMELNGGVYGGTRYLQEKTIKQFTTRQSEKSSRGIGWDTKSSDASFSGKYTSMKTFLHTGFTGTSVVVDPERKIIIIFLTNRVYPSRNSSKIFRVRPAVHNAIYEALR